MLPFFKTGRDQKNQLRISVGFNNIICPDNVYIGNSTFVKAFCFFQLTDTNTIYGILVDNGSFQKLSGLQLSQNFFLMPKVVINPILFHLAVANLRFACSIRNYEIILSG